MRARHGVARVLISAGGRIEWTLEKSLLFMPWRTDAVASSRQGARQGALAAGIKTPRRGAVPAARGGAEGERVLWLLGRKSLRCAMRKNHARFELKIVFL